MADVVRWPFERATWAIERRLLWPLRERFAGRGLPAHSVGAGALVLLGIGAILAGVLLLPGGGNAPSERVAVPTRVAVATSDAEVDAEGSPSRELQGVAPDFGAGGGVGVTGSGQGSESEPGADDLEGTESDETSLPDEAAAATSSSKKPVPAGPAAMKVARRFSEAFVFYEIGERPARAKAVFAETATPQLASALDERPPRQPADADVPRARVLNLVPGPRAGKAYTVSVSLLRVGLTSELRLELNRKQGQWFVTDVRG